ncbi:MAG TPA: helix-turn-helix transcriptional regulator [Kineosporiaceae bacterium]|nr:helix-turn-helix transcriptional regulator [Kineosporiaceae bacterium]
MLLRGLIGMVLRRVRLGQNRTLRDVAEVARVSVPYLSEVERGRKEPSSELLAAICSALDLELTDLLSEVRTEIARDRLAQVGFGSRVNGHAVNGHAVNGRPFNGRPISSATAIQPEPLSVELEQALPGSVSLGGSFGGGFGSVMVAA